MPDTQDSSSTLRLNLVGGVLILVQKDKRSVAIIGLGMASRPHALSLQALSDRVEVKGVFSPSPTRREAFASEYGFPAVDSIERIVDDDEISTVFLLTPPNARLEIVQSLCKAGKHILMEKPLERTIGNAVAIASQCEHGTGTVGVVFQNRFRDGAMRLAERLASDELGLLHSVQVQVPWWRDQAYYDEPMRGSYERDGGGVLISQAIHSLDLMLTLAGPVSEVAAIAGTTDAHVMESEDFVGAGLRFKLGAYGSLMATTAQYPGGVESIVMSGTHGTATLRGGELSIDYLNGRTEHIGDASSGGGSADPMAFSHEWHQRLIVDFLDALDEDREPAATLENALQAHRLIDALLQSSAEKQHVTLAG